MGLRPTHRKESQFSVTPAKAGVHVGNQLDSRFRGNDVTFERAERGTLVRMFQTVLRIRTWVLNLVLPNGATTLNPSFSNIDAVPCVDSFPKA